MYYLRTRPKADAIQFTVDQQQLVADKAHVQIEGVAGIHNAVAVALLMVALGLGEDCHDIQLLFYGVAAGQCCLID